MKKNNCINSNYKKYKILIFFYFDNYIITISIYIMEIAKRMLNGGVYIGNPKTILKLFKNIRTPLILYRLKGTQASEIYFCMS